MGKKILVVDDEMHILRIVRYKLESAGYEVLTALNGADALKIAREEKPALIFLDIMMPGINGYEVCSELKNDSATKDIIIIMLTAKAQEADKIKGLEVGVDELECRWLACRLNLRQPRRAEHQGQEEHR